MTRNKKYTDDWHPSQEQNTNGHICCSTHCCKYHGCKYGDEDCPVTTLKIKQIFPCENCYEKEYKIKYLNGDIFYYFDNDMKEHKVTVSTKDEIIEGK